MRQTRSAASPGWLAGGVAGTPGPYLMISGGEAERGSGTEMTVGAEGTVGTEEVTCGGGAVGAGGTVGTEEASGTGVPGGQIRPAVVSSEFPGR